MKKIHLVIVITLLSLQSVLAQEEKLTWPDGTEVIKGDSVQLDNPSMGNAYAYIKYKMKGGGISGNKTGSLSSNYQNQVVYVKKIEMGEIHLTGMGNYVFICEFDKALVKGEIKKFRLK